MDAKSPKYLILLIVVLLVSVIGAAVGINHVLISSPTADDRITSSNGDTVDVSVTIQGSENLEYPVNIRFTRLIGANTTYTHYRVYNINENERFTVSLRPNATYQVVITGSNGTRDTLHAYRTPKTDGELVLRDLIDDNS